MLDSIIAVSAIYTLAGVFYTISMKVGKVGN